MCDSSLITLLSHFSCAEKTTEDIEENFGPEVWRNCFPYMLQLEEFQGEFCQTNKW